VIPRAYSLVALALFACPKAETTSVSNPQAPTHEPPKATARARGIPAELTAAHNDVRAKVGVAPLRWSPALARHAQSWADRLASKGCPLEHRRTDAYGENLFWSSAAATPSEVVDEWAAESSRYDHRKNSCKGVCGHYTQVVWAATRTLGCGMARCGAAELWVCNYDPPGNVVGQPPY
jgi:pathogenesis-related protein 1